ncbi:MAG: transposase [Nostoc sp. EkiNYC01]|nr:transposase [Nostoc sp. EkiNYC01]
MNNYVTILECIRWNGLPKCPYCGSTNSSSLKLEKRYHCNNCYIHYSVTVNTPFHGTHIELKKWFIAVSLLLNHSKKV